MSICLLLDEQLFELKKSITHGKTCHQTKITNTTNDNYLKRLLGIMRFTAISRLDEFLYMETIAEKALYFDPQYNL